VSAAGLLAALAVLLAAAAVREATSGRRLSFDLVDGRLSLSPLLVAKILAALAGGAVGLMISPAAPGRMSLLVVVAMPVAGFLAPDALLQRRARRRQRRLVAALPDALDLLAVSAGTGRGPAAGIEQLAGAGEGPLAEELRLAVAEISCGVPLSAALSSLRSRVPGAELARLVAAIERSRQFGSPLADQLRRQATGLRRDSRRAVEERAARAAPKIQLVIALVLVPSVLLMIAAALIANAGTLLAGF
jgi:tight adherence protein C